MIVRTLSIIQHKVIYECTTLKSKGKRKKEKNGHRTESNRIAPLCNLLGKDQLFLTTCLLGISCAHSLALQK